MPSTCYESLWSNPQINDRIEQGITEHRQSDACFQLIDTTGRPIANETVRVEQITSDFLFGANIFMLDGYAETALNRRYEQAFAHLFNAATVPFYWCDLEPQPGQLRFEANSEPVARRPPPDRVVDFCQTHGLNMNGHTLVWDFDPWSVPSWLSDEACRTAEPWQQRIQQIAE